LIVPVFRARIITPGLEREVADARLPNPWPPCGSVISSGEIVNPRSFRAAFGLISDLGPLSFLVTTPEAWVPALGDAQHGFPYLSSAGRLVLKDVLLLAGAWLVMADSARALLATWGICGPLARSH